MSMPRTKTARRLCTRRRCWPEGRGGIAAGQQCRRQCQGQQWLDAFARGGVFGRKDVAELLLASNADVNARDKSGETPLRYAAGTGWKDMVELLLANNAEVNAKDNKGETPLRLALDKGQKEVAELLRQHGGHE